MAANLRIYRENYFTLYKYLRRSIDHYMPSEEARAFMNDRVRRAFREHRSCTDPQRLEELLQRAHTVLLACQPEEEDEAGADSGGAAQQ